MLRLCYLVDVEGRRVVSFEMEFRAILGLDYSPRGLREEGLGDRGVVLLVVYQPSLRIYRSLS